MLADLSDKNKKYPSVHFCHLNLFYTILLLSAQFILYNIHSFMLYGYTHTILGDNLC